MVTETTYLLGNDDPELRRLEQQGAMLAPSTQTILSLAGIEPGMKVLDLGTGAGDVALLAAEMAGPGGEVIGVDQSQEALSWAERRREIRGLTNVSFVHGDLHSVEIEGTFDAVVGRLVLLYTPDPAAILRRFAGLVREGGLVVAMEYEMTAAGAIPSIPMSEQVVGWITEAFRRSGLEPSLGADLGRVMADAGLDPTTVLGLQAYFRPEDPRGPHMAAELIRTLLPVLEHTGVASPAEIDIETLERRIATEMVEHDAIFTPPTLVGAWATVTLDSD